MYSLTFRVRVTTPRSMDEMERPRCRCVDFIAGEGSFRLHAYSACGGPRGLPQGSATHMALPRISSVAIATQPVHQLQIRPIVHNKEASPTTSPSDVTYMWSQCDLHFVSQHVVQCVVKWWRFVALFE